MSHAPSAPSSLWERFHAERDRASRDALLVHYLPLVARVASRLATRLPIVVDRRDLAGDGVFGLLDAIQRFRPDRGVPFEAFAATRIRGAMIDGLRALDWAPRDVRYRLRVIEEARDHLRNSLQRTPSHPEIAAHLGIAEADYRGMLGESEAASMIALDALVASGEEDILVAEDAVEDSSLLGAAIHALPVRYRMLLRLRYGEDMTFAEMGAALHLSETRVIQLHRRAIEQLRQQLDADHGVE